MAESKDVEQRYTELADFIETELDPSHKLTKPRLASLKDMVRKWAFAQAELLGEIKSLKEQNQSLKNEVDQIKKESQQIQPTFADIIQKQPVTFTNSIIKKSQVKNTLFITSNKGEEIKTIQEKFTKNINPAKEGIKIRNMRTTQKMLIVETESKEDLEKITMNQKLKDELQMEPPRKRKPLIAIYDLQSKWDNDYIKEAIYVQNLKDKITYDEFYNGFSLKFKTGPRDKPTVHHVAEVEPKIRKLLLNQHRLYLGFYATRIKDYIVVPRCMKCQDFGHVGKHCSAEGHTCGHCAGKHQKAECQNKDKEQVCVPCNKRNKKCKGGNDCQTYKMMMERLVEKTDYGQ